MNERTPVLPRRSGVAGRRARRRVGGRGPAEVARVLLGLVVALFATFGVAAGPALAVNEVVTSEPADGTTLAASPSQIVITFTEEIGELRTISVECNTEIYSLPAPTLSGNERVMTVAVPEPGLPRGLCVATWRVSDADDEPNGSGLISFTIEADPTVTSVDGTTGDATTTSVDGAAVDAAADDADASTPSTDAAVTDLAYVDAGQGPLWLGRVLSTIGIAVVFGGLVVIAAAWPEGVEYLITIRFLRAAWVLALIGTLLYVAAASAAVTGSSLGSGFNPGSWIDLMDAGWAGRAALLRLVFVIAAAWSAFRPDRVIDPVTQMAALGVPALAVAMVGVGRVNGNLAALGVVIGIAHAIAMAIWIGGAILLARVVLLGPGDEDLVHAVRGFSRISVGAIVVTIVTGLVQMVRLDGGQLFDSGHGRVTVLKVLLVAGMVFVGLSARQFAQQRLSRAHELTVPMADRLRRAFGIEAAIGLVTLLASAWLLALSPVNVSAAPSIDYAIERRIEVVEGEETVLDVTIKLTRDRVGPNGLEVRVDAPTEGITGLEVVFTPPADGVTSAIAQPVPLTGAGRAVRTEAAGLPIGVPGTWQIQVNANTAAGLVSSDPIGVQILDADGAGPTTSISVPPSVLVTIDPDASTTIPG